jgi:hypothetical protein
VELLPRQRVLIVPCIDRGAALPGNPGGADHHLETSGLSNVSPSSPIPRIDQNRLPCCLSVGDERGEGDAHPWFDGQGADGAGEWAVIEHSHPAARQSDPIEQGGSYCWIWGRRRQGARELASTRFE